jgi:streptogramin lyase
MSPRLLVAAVPAVAAVVIAGIVSSPSKVRPCVTEFTKGINGFPTHIVLGPEGDLYAAEEPQKKVLRFNPDTHLTRHYDVGVEPHDLTVGPDKRIWFLSSQKDAMGSFDPKTGEVKRYRGISHKSEPHMLRWARDGRLYITEQKAGRMAVFDPKTERIVERDFGLPPHNSIHNTVELPNGDFWAVLQGTGQLARLNLKRGRFDRFVDLPRRSAPRDITYVRSRNTIYATTFAANKIVEYDLDTGHLALYKTHVDPIPFEDALDRRVSKLTFVRPDAKEKYVWISTLNGGELLRFDPRTHAIKRVGCGVTIPNGPLGLVNDRKGRLWYAVPFPKGAIGRVDM